MKIFIALLLSLSFITVVIGPSKWRQLWKGSSSSSGSSRRQEGSGYAPGQGSTIITPQHIGLIVIQQPGEEGQQVHVIAQPTETVTLHVRMRDIGLLVSAEYGRLMNIVNQKKGYKNVRNEDQVQANAQVPWLADVGQLIGKNTFIRFCAASLLHLDEGEMSNVLITSAACGLMLEEAGKQARVKFYGPKKDEQLKVLEIKYLKNHVHGIEGNLAILQIKPRKISERSQQLRLTPHSGETDTEIIWREYDYQDHDGAITSNLRHEALDCRAGCFSCSENTFCMTNEISDKPDLGGAPLCDVMGSNFEHPVLIGVRNGLDGDHFTDIDDDRIKAWIMDTAAELH